MTIEINNLTSQGVNNTQGRRQPVTTEQEAKSKGTVSNPIADNIVRVDFETRQDVAEVSDTKSQQDKSNTSNIASVVNDISRSAQLIDRRLEFEIDDNSGRTVITVKDSKTQEVIRQIPSEQLLEVSARLKELQIEKSTNPEVQAQGILFTSQT